MYTTYSIYTYVKNIKCRNTNLLNVQQLIENKFEKLKLNKTKQVNKTFNNTNNNINTTRCSTSNTRTSALNSLIYKNKCLI